MHLKEVVCGCEFGYAGPLGDTCERCEGNGYRDVAVADEGDCLACKGRGKIAFIIQLVDCGECKGTGRAT